MNSFKLKFFRSKPFEDSFRRKFSFSIHKRVFKSYGQKNLPILFFPIIPIISYKYTLNEEGASLLPVKTTLKTSKVTTFTYSSAINHIK